jgi:hypothetical protein
VKEIAGKDVANMPATTRANVTDTSMELIREFPLRRIETAADHRRATKLVLRLSVAESNRGVAEHLDVLVDLVALFRSRHREPDICVAFGEPAETLAAAAE